MKTKHRIQRFGKELVLGIQRAYSALTQTETSGGYVYGGKTASGADITEQTAFNYSTVYACLRVLTGYFSILPITVRRNIGDRRTEDAKNNPAYKILAKKPNPEQTPSTWKKMGMLHLCTYGNFYNYINRNGKGEPVELWPLLPWRMKVYRNPEGKIRYQYTTSDGTTLDMDSFNILHIPGLSFDGLVGKSVIGAHRESIGLAVSAEEFGARFFSNGASLKGVLSVQGSLDDEQAARMRSEWNSLYTGNENSHKVAVLEEGTKYEKISISPNDAQFIETRSFQDEVICGIFGVPPQLIQKTEKVTSFGTGIEQMMIAFYTGSLLPHVVAFEEALAIKLLDDDDCFVKFKSAALMRGDFKARMEGYRLAKYAGFFSTNDIRELEDMNPVEGGDEYWTPLNMDQSLDGGKDNGK